jgi:hypothetical protein
VVEILKAQVIWYYTSKEIAKKVISGFLIMGAENPRGEIHFQEIAKTMTQRV